MSKPVQKPTVWEIAYFVATLAALAVGGVAVLGYLLR